MYVYVGTSRYVCLWKTADVCMFICELADVCASVKTSKKYAYVCVGKQMMYVYPCEPVDVCVCLCGNMRVLFGNQLVPAYLWEPTNMCVCFWEV